MFCPQCGASNPDGAAFCESCGAPLRGEAPAKKTAAPARRNSPLLWAALILSLLVILALVLVLLHLRGNTAPQTPAATAIPAPAATAAPAAPTPEVIIVTPSPASAPTPVPTVPATPAPTLPPTPAPTLPPTPAPTPAPGPIAMDTEKQYQANVFLSNFSEQGFGIFDAEDRDYAQMIAFLHIFCKINRQDLISYQGGEETISKADVNSLLVRFFALSYTPGENEYFYPAYSSSFYYWNGYYRWPAADGESYNYFTVVDELRRNADGTVTADFQIYEVGLEEYWNVPGVDRAYYYMNSAAVADMVWAQRVTPVRGGTALLRPYDNYGVASYQLLRYETWSIEFAMP